MICGGKAMRTIWVPSALGDVSIIDQTRLPEALVERSLPDVEAAAHAIRSMQVRGAPLIGVAAAYAMSLASRSDPSDEALERAQALLASTRPTAVNLAWALAEMRAVWRPLRPMERASACYEKAAAMAEADVASCRAIALAGAPVLEAHRSEGAPLRVLTHCNAGWLATVDWGTALAPLYELHARGVPLHVWVDETRPRNQGYLTAWELTEAGIPNTLIADNAGGLLMRRGEVDVCIVGSDRTARNGDVCNKIGTYLKALAARASQVPFYVALPWSTIDLEIADGDAIPIEEREPSELTTLPFRVLNPAFDVTPAALVTALITDQGVFAPGSLRSRNPPGPERRRS